MDFSSISIIFIAYFFSLKGFSEGFVLKTQVDLPDPKVAELDKISELRPKLVKAIYEVTFLVDNSINLLDSDYLVGRSASPTVENKLFSNRKPTLVKVETVTESLVRKDDDDVPVIKGYDPDETKHLAEAIEELKKQTDQKVKLENSQNNYGHNGWSSAWRPVARSGERTPYDRAHYLPPIPCCSDAPRPQWRI